MTTVRAPGTSGSPQILSMSARGTGFVFTAIRPVAISTTSAGSSAR